MISYYQNTRNELEFDQQRVSGRVLEIGCGNGAYLSNIACTEKWGVEPFAVGKPVCDFDQFYADTFENIYEKLPKSYFDHIIMNDVLEHMWNTEETITKIKSLLKQNGELRISIPNVRYIENIYLLVIKGKWDYTDYGILDRTHMRFFTKKSFVKYFNVGWKLQECVGINPIGKLNKGKWLLIDWILKLVGSDMRYLQYYFIYKKL